jgi:hypothetical protein
MRGAQRARCSRQELGAAASRTTRTLRCGPFRRAPLDHRLGRRGARQRCRSAPSIRRPQTRRPSATPPKILPSLLARPRREPQRPLLIAAAPPRRRSRRKGAPARTGEAEHAGRTLCPRSRGQLSSPQDLPPKSRIKLRVAYQRRSPERPQARFWCHAFGCRNARIPYVDSVEPMPECLRPVQGKRGLTRSQQLTYTLPAFTRSMMARARSASRV